MCPPCCCGAGEAAAQRLSSLHTPEPSRKAGGDCRAQEPSAGGSRSLQPPGSCRHPKMQLFQGQAQQLRDEAGHSPGQECQVMLDRSNPSARQGGAGHCTTPASKACLAHTEGTRGWEMAWGDLHGAGECWGTAFISGAPLQEGAAGVSPEKATEMF